ncbi:MAG: hypothetical protein HUU22_15430 [Phycisphaerae bacterium]|nr:dockerin type I domain-containing protein [Phycisphaerae bacterium]NUQ47416.1 hypothetical protein [Phycisphaerae bacterium]
MTKQIDLGGFLSCAVIVTLGCAANARAQDCNTNGTLDSQEISEGAPDCNSNGTIDDCEVAQLGYALFFSGDYVRVANSPAMSITSSLTIEVWMQANNPGGVWQQIVFKGDGQSGRDPYYLRLTGNNLEFGIDNDANQGVRLFVNVQSYNWSQYHHVAAVFDDPADEMRMYVDGQLVGVRMTTFTPLSNQAAMDLWIGAATGEQYFNGRLDEVRLWNVARTGAQVANHMSAYLSGQETGLVGLWHFDEGSSQVASDATSFQHHGQLGSTPQADSADPTWVPADILIGAPDCNTNGTIDECDVMSAAVSDCDGDMVPDECQPGGAGDCNTNEAPDGPCDIGGGLSQDCNTDVVPDECQLANADCNVNGVPDVCEPDCNTNASADDCDVATGAGDCNVNGMPDECDIAPAQSGDCNTNAIPDECEPGYATDCNTNGLPDLCDFTPDCNTTGTLDACDIALGVSDDPDGDLIPSECDTCVLFYNPAQSVWLRQQIQANDAGAGTSIRMSPEGHVAMAFYDADSPTSGTLRWWYDDDDDLSADALEIRILDTSPNAGVFSSLAFDADGRATIAYYVIAGGNLKLWHDANGDRAAQAGELALIDSPNDVGQYASLAFSPSGMAVVAYHDATNSDLRLWVDLNGNFAGDLGEARVIQSTGSVGSHCSLAFDSDGRAVVAYYDIGNGDLRIWHDSNGNFAVDSLEIRTIDSTGQVGQYTSLRFTESGNAVVAYYAVTPQDLKLWYDADGDLSLDAGEIRTVDFAGNVGQYAALTFSPQGRALAAYYDASNADLKLWHDLDGDLAFDAGELQTVWSSGSVGTFASITFDPRRFTPVIAARDQTNAAVVLAAHFDWDDDGACFADDNCPLSPDPLDTDGDGIGDACDACPLRIPGDINGDGQVDVLDVSPLASVLIDPAGAEPEARCAADLNGDGNPDGDDIGPFVGLIAGG